MLKSMSINSCIASSLPNVDELYEKPRMLGPPPKGYACAERPNGDGDDEEEDRDWRPNVS